MASGTRLGFLQPFLALGCRFQAYANSILPSGRYLVLWESMLGSDNHFWGSKESTLGSVISVRKFKLKLSMKLQLNLIRNLAKVSREIS